MTPKKKRTALGAALLASILIFAGCSGADSTQSEVAAASTESSSVGSITGDTAGDQTGDDAQLTITENQESHYDADDLDYEQSEVVAITLDTSSAVADSGDVTIDGSTVTITAEGVYSLSGTLIDGRIIVDAADSDDVTLILDDADITNATGAAIAVMNADEAAIVLADGSTNRLTDGAAYTFPDPESDEPNAALYSAADLTIAGEGQLIVNANYNDGITSKDGLVIESGTITVAAADDGIRGKDYVIVSGGTISVEAGGDGIKADNNEDADRGYVLVSDGLVNIGAGDDGVQGTTDVLVTGGDLTIDAGSGSDSGRAIQGDVMVVVSGGAIDATSVDDAIHSNNEVTVDGGTLTLASGDDGIHGDLSVTINGGSITITDSFEGIESEVITINDGFIDVTSNDDGLNVASADATAATTVQPGPDTAAAGTADVALRPAPPGGGGPRGGGGAGGGGGGDAGVGEHYIYINGGTTVITITGNLAEQGDGIDANGHIEMTGGVVAVSGPTDTRNSAIDYSGGSFVMTGGLFIGTNIDGRNSEGIGSGSSQASLYLTPGSTFSAGTVVHIESTSGDGLVTFEPANPYSVIVFSSPDLVDGQAYDLYLGGTVSGDSASDLYEDQAYTPGDLAGTFTATTAG